MDDHRNLLSFFGLGKHPFAPTADPANFYATREHRDCLFRLWSSIDQRHGIAVVLGSYGTGKTTLLRKLTAAMLADPARYRTAIIGSPLPSWTSFSLLEAIAAQFGVQPREANFTDYMQALSEALLAGRDKTTTLIIDDAQNLNKRGQLELLRLLQNIETQQHKLLNVVCFAQLVWKQVLRAAPGFAQRINLTHTLEPITSAESRQFIEFRIAQAVKDPAKQPRFTEAAHAAIHRHAAGNPRIIVSTCRNALLAAMQTGTRTIDEVLIASTIAKTTVLEMEKPVERARPLPVVAVQAAEPLPVFTFPKEPESEPTPRPVSLFARAAAQETGRTRQPETRMTRDQRAAELLMRKQQDRNT